MTYCISDIHGDFKGYKYLLEKVSFSDNDTLFVLGDVIDRGEGGMEILKDMMMRPNVFPILGNHEYMAIPCMKFLLTEITEESIKDLDENIIRGLMEWQNVGGYTTMDAFHRLTQEEKEDIYEYLREFSLYEEIKVNGKKFVLVHAGITGFDANTPLEEYPFSNFLFKVPNYNRVYYPDKYLVTGHLPTCAIHQNKRPYFIYKGNNHIAIDCGSYCGGQLGMICLDTMKEFYYNYKEERGN